MEKVVETLFPNHNRISYVKRRNETADSPLLVMDVELLVIAKRMENYKAAGIDCKPSKALKKAITSKTNLFAKMYIACITEEVFSDRWKVQHLILLP